MKIHRTLRTALLALLLLLSQQMGFSHAVSHLSISHGSQTEQPIPLEKACNLCLAFSQIGNALTDECCLGRAPAPAVTDFATGPGTLHFPAIVFAFNSRAPPLAV